ncbi:MAG: helix-turn-helix domain-containing protein [Pseudobutyrivibrio sp.]|mgnify:CR=1 FL=1|nr:helix-turn-helix domain-containing protein [Pseudobutyrivibrio sp.]
MSKNNIGNNIKFLRQNAGLTQAQLGKIFGVSHVTVSTWESGRTMPTPDIVEGLCMTLHCRKEEILGFGYAGREKDVQRKKLNEYFDALSEDNRHLLLVRAKELVNLEAEMGGYSNANAS